MSAQPRDEGNPAPWWSLFLPGLGADLFLVGLACFLFVRPLMLLWDGGTCRHVLIGLYILKEHRIPTNNWVSAFFSHLPFIPHSLFGDVIYGLAYEIGKLNGLVLVVSAVLALCLTWSFQFARRRGLGFLSGWLLLTLVILSSSLHWSARCQEFSHLFFLALYYVTFLAPITWTVRLAFSAAIMLLWTNFHGTFLLGLLMLSVRVFADCLEKGFCLEPDPASGQAASPGQAVPEANSAKSIFPGLITLAVSAGACCVNVRGPGIYAFVLNGLANPMILFRTSEYRSVDFSLGLQVWSFVALYGIVVTLWVLSGLRPRLWEWLLLNMLFIGALFTMRLIPYFALAALPAAGPPWAAIRRELLTARSKGIPLLRRAAISFARSELRLESEEKLAVAAPGLRWARAAIALAMALVFLTVPGLKISDFDPARLPVEAVSFLGRQERNRLVFALDNWGGYLYFRLGRPVLLDDWTSAYPLTLWQDYLATMMAQTGWQNVLDKYSIGFVLIPRATLLGAALSGSPGWRRIYQDQISEIYERVSSPPVNSVDPLMSGH